MEIAREDRITSSSLGRLGVLQIHPTPNGNMSEKVQLVVQRRTQNHSQTHDPNDECGTVQLPSPALAVQKFID